MEKLEAATFYKAKCGGNRCHAPAMKRCQGRGAAMLATLLLLALATPALAAPFKLAAGAFHGVALHNDGTVWTWGYNRWGQLGNGTTNNSAIPARVPGLTGVISVRAGEGHTVALKSDGTVWTWGDGGVGQLGNGSAIGSATPGQVPGLTGVVSIGAGLMHTLAVKSDGTVWGWGLNGQGQLGNGSTGSALSPVQASGLTGARSVAGGRDHTVAVKNDGTVWCWGGNSLGQLGIGTVIRRITPVMVPGLSGITEVAAAENQTMALNDDGEVWAWGDNEVGQLGDGTRTIRTTPVQVVGLPTGVAALAPAMYHTVALLADGTVWFWGYKVLVNGYPDQDNVAPERAAAVSDITAVASGNGFILALAKDGSISAWGENRDGELGSGAPSYRLVATQVPGVDQAAAVSTSSHHTLALKKDGTVWGWGSNAYGSLGNGGTRHSFVPVQAVGLSGITRVSAGGAHSLALQGNGTLWSWGSNRNGQSGNGSTESSSIPLQIPGFDGITAVAAGMDFSLAVKNDGTVWAWGNNDNGELGRTDIPQSDTPLQITELSNVIAVSAGEHHGMALRTDGSVWVWGAHLYGNITSRNVVQVAEAGIVSRLAAGTRHSLMLSNLPGTLWGWGSNGSGELGDGSTIPRAAPVRVAILWENVTDVAAGWQFSIALKDDGTVWSWGDNDYGELGIGSTTPTAYPWQALQLSGVTDVAAGANHAIAVKADGTVWAWGDNGFGQLGTNPGWLPLQAQINLGPQQAVLTVAISGNGIGAVHSIPTGIACTTPQCTATFPFGTEVTLRASSGTGSIFAGWAGSCIGTGDCVLAMNSDKLVSAAFTVSQPVRRGSTGYDTLAAAYLAAPTGAWLLTRDGDFLEGLTADRNVAVKITGGYYADFSGRSGLPTRLRGKVVIRRGTLKVDRIKVI